MRFRLQSLHMYAWEKKLLRLPMKWALQHRWIFAVGTSAELGVKNLHVCVCVSPECCAHRLPRQAVGE